MVKKIQLSERSILSFRYEEESEEKHASTGTEPDERRFALQIPSGWVERVTPNISHRYGEEIVGSACESARFSAELDRGEFGDNGKGDGSDSKAVRGVDEHEECRLSPE